MAKKEHEKKQKSNERRSFIDFRATYLGEIGRRHVVERFGISDPSASNEIGDYIKLKPENLKYDFKTRTHKATDQFEPQFDFSTSQVLKALSSGFGDTLERVPVPFIQTAAAVELNQPNPANIAQISRAIYQNKMAQIIYQSLSSGRTTRVIAPFALINSGLRWHVRAFDRRSGEYRDFVLARVTSARLLDEKIPQEESSANDESWTNVITLEIVPHPENIKEKKAIELDYGMKKGVLNLELRQSIAGYILRNWNVDCTKDHRLEGAHYQLWLKNSKNISDLNKIILAPGVETR
jgi:predicted DNA-binding transcriptional regulator YafY